MKILAIETSCDETAAALIEVRSNKAIDTKILSNVVASQINIHKKFGGVFPEHASRAHTEKIIPVVEEALAKEKNKIDLIAVTTGPGLIGSLLVGVNFAKTYAFAKNLPIIGINHWLGHIYSNFVGEKPSFPSLILIVSGGHTGLVLMKSHNDIQPLGETLDDAAGEAFDKVAKMLGLGYPGGPAIAESASKFLRSKSLVIASVSEAIRLSLREATRRSNLLIDRHAPQARDDDSKSQIPNIKFPRSMLDRPGYDFSFSGLKTAVLYKFKEIQSLNHYKSRDEVANHYKSLIAYEFQQTVIDILVGKTIQAACEFRPKSICLCGGVSANKELRKQMAQRIIQSLNHVAKPQITFHVPPMELTTDNAVMIGIAAAYQNKSKWSTWDKINADANLRL